MSDPEIESLKTLSESQLSNEWSQQRRIRLLGIRAGLQRAHYLVEAMVLHHDNENAIKVTASAFAKSAEATATQAAVAAIPRVIRRASSVKDERIIGSPAM
jgi:hypothetical protein